MATINAEITHNGNPPFMRIAKIKHELIDGAHVFTCDDVQGFITMSNNKSVAIEQIIPVMERLIQSNMGFECQVSLGKSMAREDNNEPQFAVINKKAA